MSDNYSPELERAQLLEDFKVADAKYSEATEKNNDARLTRAKLLLAMQETFPVTGLCGRNPIRSGFGPWCKENIPISYHRVSSELKYARNPELLKINRAKNVKRVLSSQGLFTVAMNKMRKGWPIWTDDQRQKIVNQVVELANAS